MNVPKDCPNHERGIQPFKMNSLLASALMPTLFLWPLNIKKFVCRKVDICRLFKFCHSKLKSSQLYSLCSNIACLYSIRFSRVALMLSLCKLLKEIWSQFCFERVFSANDDAESNFCLREGSARSQIHNIKLNKNLQWQLAVTLY